MASSFSPRPSLYSELDGTDGLLNTRGAARFSGGALCIHRSGARREHSRLRLEALETHSCKLRIAKLRLLAKYSSPLSNRSAIVFSAVSVLPDLYFPFSEDQDQQRHL